MPWTHPSILLKLGMNLQSSKCFPEPRPEWASQTSMKEAILCPSMMKVGAVLANFKLFPLCGGIIVFILLGCLAGVWGKRCRSDWDCAAEIALKKGHTQFPSYKPTLLECALKKRSKDGRTCQGSLLELREQLRGCPSASENAVDGVGAVGRLHGCSRCWFSFRQFKPWCFFSVRLIAECWCQGLLGLPLSTYCICQPGTELTQIYPAHTGDCRVLSRGEQMDKPPFRSLQWGFPVEQKRAAKPSEREKLEESSLYLSSPESACPCRVTWWCAQGCHTCQPRAIDCGN